MSPGAGFWYGILQHAPALAVLGIVVIAFLRYLRYRDERNEETHARHERIVNRVCKSFDDSNKRLVELADNGSRSGGT